MVKWFRDKGKPLSEEETTEMLRKFSDLGFEFEQIDLAEDDDLKDLCPDKWGLTRKWALKQALKELRGEIKKTISEIAIFNNLVYFIATLQVVSAFKNLTLACIVSIILCRHG